MTVEATETPKLVEGTPPLLGVALALHAHGYCPIPASTNGLKQPWPDGPKWDRYKTERPTEQQIRAWFQGGRYDGLGLVCGAVSGNLEMFEFEGRAVAEGYPGRMAAAMEEHGMGDLWKRLTEGYLELTPSRGLHRLYRVDGELRGSTKLARRPSTAEELAAWKRSEQVKVDAEPDEAKRHRRQHALDGITRGEQVPQVLIETRGEGGFTIVAPSGGRTHPSGEAWQLMAGGAASIPTITEEERDALYAIASLLDSMPAKQSPPRPAASGAGRNGDDGLRPGDDFNNKADWSEILEPHGWTHTTNYGQARGWTRPGKSVGTSATTGKNDGDNLFVFSTNTGFETEEPYSKFGAYALLEHRGDHAAAARELRRQGYGSPRADPDRRVADLVAPRPNTEERPATATEAQAYPEQGDPEQDHYDEATERPAPSYEQILRGLHQTGEQAHASWVDPEPLEGAGPPPAPFPVEVLPGPIREYVTALADMTQTPVDMSAMTSLGALSVAAGNRAWVNGGNGWIEPLTLWTITVLPPASRKSAVTSAVSKPLYSIERDARVAHAEKYRGQEDQLEIAEKRKDKLIRDAVGAESGAKRNEITAELDAVSGEIADLTPKPAPRLLVDDFTPEALSITLQNNGGHVGVVTAEGGVFAAISGRYQQGTPQLDLILKSYDGDPYRSDRVGREPVTIDRPAVTLALTVQPHILAETTKQPALRERGLMGRFAYSVPTDTVGARSVDAPEMPGSVAGQWYRLLEHITGIPVCADDDELRIMQLAPDALELHRSFREHLEPRLHGETGDLAFMADWVGKLAGRILRIAGLLHLAERHRSDRPISFDTMRAAVEIGEYMLTHAVAVYGGWRASSDDLDAVRVLRWIKRARMATFTVKDAYEALRGQAWCKRSDDVKEALVVLAKAGWLTSVERLMSDGKRRLRDGTFIPHPNLLKETP